MREIKFRGKCFVSGEWVYGWLIQTEPNKKDGKCSAYILEPIVFIPAVSMPSEKFIKVIPETVGQYTGLPDKRGTELYRGDIISTHMGNRIIIWGTSSIAFGWFMPLVKEHWAYSFNEIALYNDPKKCEKIGNKWDNPELLQVKG